jgi:uncharacterized SAM-binding protein YcdF (DUF218 family)
VPIFFIALVAGLGWLVGRSAMSAAAPAPLPAPAPQRVLSAGRGYSGPHGHPYGSAAHRMLAPGTPSPIIVLHGYLRSGDHPPPHVVLCAIAEAELDGNMLLRDEIVRTYVEPTVRAAQEANAIDVEGHEAPDGDGGDDVTPASPGDPDADTRAALEATGMDAEQVNASIEQIQRERAQRAPATPPPSDVVSGDGDTVIAGALANLADLDLGAAGPSRPWTSPIAGVGGNAWGAFVGRVEREAPTYASDKHVGRFRQRRERLAALGLDPDAVARSTDAQLVALEREMGDAHMHASQSGLVEHVGKKIALPPEHAGGRPTTAIVSLSGLLGVIQAAGLEGACDWLDKPRDRQRFPHTTAAFVRTNNLF